MASSSLSLISQKHSRQQYYISSNMKKHEKSFDLKSEAAGRRGFKSLQLSNLFPFKNG